MDLVNLEKQIANNIELEDLNDELRYVAEYIGIEKVRQIIKVAGGIRLYIPSIDKFKNKFIEKDIKENILKCHKPLSAFELSRRYKVTKSTIEAILSKYEQSS